MLMLRHSCIRLSPTPYLYVYVYWWYLQVVVVQMNGTDHTSETIHVLHIGRMRMKLCKGKTSIAKEYYSTSMQVLIMPSPLPFLSFRCCENLYRIIEREQLRSCIYNQQGIGPPCVQICSTNNRPKDYNFLFWFFWLIMMFKCLDSGIYALQFEQLPTLFP